MREMTGRAWCRVGPRVRGAAGPSAVGKCLSLIVPRFIRASPRCGSESRWPICRRVIDSGLVGSEGYRGSRRFSRDTYPESYITKHTSIRREMPQPRAAFQSMWINTAHVRQPSPDSGLDFQAKLLKRFLRSPPWLGSGSRRDSSAKAASANRHQGGTSRQRGTANRGSLVRMPSAAQQQLERSRNTIKVTSPFPVHHPMTLKVGRDRGMHETGGRGQAVVRAQTRVVMFARLSLYVSALRHTVGNTVGMTSPL